MIPKISFIFKIELTRYSNFYPNQTVLGICVSIVSNVEKRKEYIMLPTGTEVKSEYGSGLGSEKIRCSMYT
jgi:hypothetical protein